MTQETITIDLMSRGTKPTPSQQAHSGPAPDGHMTMEALRSNYETIVRARAVYYPVAFHFQRELGRGRQGQVFLALRQGARGCVTEYAVKLFDPMLYRSPEEYWTDMGRIANQISRLHRVQSPNLVSRHAYEETYGIGYLQMEAIDGLDLSKLLSGRHIDIVRQRSTQTEWERFFRTIFRQHAGRLALQPGVVVYILRGMLRGLESLHTTNFLHGDIKPANVMIDRLGTVKIVDFGRAVMAGEKLSFLLGSPLYMAPEMHRRQGGEPQSDFYSVGLMALEMLIGNHVCGAAESEKELLDAKMALPGKLQEILPPDVAVNKHLVSILRRFIEPDPKVRFSSALEADASDRGLKMIDKQLVRANLDSEYARDLSDYLSKLVNQHTQRIDFD